ncbi:MAG: type VI secretion system protein TssA [Caldimonas sp.]
MLSALAGDAPCGPDLEYAPAFQAMLEAGAGKPERQYGDKVYPAEPPDWPAVHEHALQLAAQTRDLRVAVWLVRSGARLHGLAGAVSGLQLVHGLVDRHWQHVNPPLDESDNNDPTARVTALMALAKDTDGLADLRTASLTGKRGALTVRDVELALGASDLLPGETAPTEDGVIQAIQTALGENSELAAQMQAGYEAAQGLANGLERHLEASEGLDLAPLKKVLQRVSEAGRKATGSPVGSTEGVGATDASGPRLVGTIGSREDVQRSLDRVCDWIERNEPTNPAPLLIRRAQRLMSKNFIDIIRDVAPEGLRDIEKLAGLGNS